MSEYNQNVRGYMHDGLGEKEAKSKATKTDIVVADDIDDNINGMYDSAMQRIVLNANNESALYSTVFHEGVGEVLQAYNAAEDVAAMAEKRASKVRKMILDELDVAIENAQNATLDENAKSSAAYSVGDYVLEHKSYTYDAKNNEFVSDDGRIIPVTDKIFSVSDIKNAEYIVRELVADQMNGLKGRVFIIKETGEKVHVSRSLENTHTTDSRNMHQQLTKRSR